MRRTIKIQFTFNEASLQAAIDRLNQSRATKNGVLKDVAIVSPDGITKLGVLVIEEDI